MKFWSKYTNFYSQKFIQTYRLRIGGHRVQGDELSWMVLVYFVGNISFSRHKEFGFLWIWHYISRFGCMKYILFTLRMLVNFTYAWNKNVVSYVIPINRKSILYKQRFSLMPACNYASSVVHQSVINTKAFEGWPQIAKRWLFPNCLVFLTF